MKFHHYLHYSLMAYYLQMIFFDWPGDSKQGLKDMIDFHAYSKNKWHFEAK